MAGCGQQRLKAPERLAQRLEGQAGFITRSWNQRRVQWLAGCWPICLAAARTCCHGRDYGPCPCADATGASDSVDRKEIFSDSQGCDLVAWVAIDSVADILCGMAGFALMTWVIRERLCRE